MFFQLKIKELEAYEWRDKFLTVETKYDYLNEEHGTQKSQLNALQLQCNELQALLLDYKQSNNSDDSSIVCENNSEACNRVCCMLTAADLEDAVKQREETKVLLKESLDKELELNAEICNYKSKLHNLDVSYKELQKDNDILTKKLVEMDNLQDSFDNLKDKFNTISAELDQSKIINLNISHEVEHLKQSLTATESRLKEKDELCESTAADLSHCKNYCKQLDDKYTMKCTQYEDLSVESSALHSKYATLIERFNKTTFELAAMTKNYEQLDSNIELLLRKIQSNILEESTCEKYENNVMFLDNLIHRLEENKNKNVDERQNLQEKVNNLELIGNHLEKRLKCLEKQQAIDLQEKENLNSNILSLQEHIDELNESICEYTNKIKELEGTIKSLDQNINTLEDLNSCLTKENNECKSILTKKEEEISEMTATESKQKLQIENMQKDINALQLNVISQRDQILKFEENLMLASNEMLKKKDELEQFQMLHQELKEDYEITTSKLTNKVKVLTETVAEVEKELESKLNENKQMQEMLENQIRKYKEIETDKQSIVDQYNEISKKLNLELEKLIAKELEICDKNKTIILYEEKIASLKSSIETKDTALKDVQQLLTNHQATIDILQNNIEQLTDTKEQLHVTISDLRQELELLNTLKENLTDKNCSLKNNVERLLKELSAKNEELLAALEDLNMYKKNSATELNDSRKKLSEALQQLDQLTDTHKMCVSDHEKEIKTLNNQIDSLNETINALNVKEIDYIQELQLIKQKMHDYVEKYTIALQTQQEIKQEYETQIETLTESLHNLLQKYNKLEEQSAVELQAAHGKIKDVEKSNETLEAQLVEEKHTYENHFKEMENQLNSEITDLKLKQVNLEQQSETLNTQLCTSKEHNLELEKEIHEITNKLKQVTVEKAELQRKHSNLNDNYDKMLNDVESMKEQNDTKIASLQKSLDDLIKERDTLLEEKNKNEAKLTETRSQVEELTNDIHILKTNQEVLFKEKNKEISATFEQLNEYENRIFCLTEENSYLTSSWEKAEEKMNELNTTCEADKVKLEEYEAKCTQFKTAADLLETGKRKLEIECQNLLKNCNFLKDEKNEIRRDYDGKIQEKLQEISKLNDHITYYQECNDVKDQTIIMLETNIKDLTAKLEGKNTFIDQLKLEYDDLEKKLNRLKEYYELKLSTKDIKIDELKTFHNITTTDLIHLKTDNADLKRQINDYVKEKEALQELFSEKESVIFLLTQQKNEQEEIIQVIRNELSELSEKFNFKTLEIQCLENEKYQLQTELNKSLAEMEKLKANRDDLLDSQTKMLKETENNILRAHNNAIEVKNDLLKRIEQADMEAIKEKELRLEVENLLKQEKENKDLLNNRVLQLECDKNKMIDIFKMISSNLNKLSCLIQEKPVALDGEIVDYDIETINDVIIDLESRVVDIFKKKRELTEIIQHLEDNKQELNTALKELAEEKDLLNDEKKKLLTKYDNLQNEKNTLDNLHENENKSLELMSVELKALQEKYETLTLNAAKSEDLLHEKTELQDSLDKMKESNEKIYENYKYLIHTSKTYKEKLKQIWRTRNELEELINKIKPKWIDLEMRTYHLKESQHKQLFETKQSLSFIFDNTIKEFLKLTKNIYNANVSLTQITETYLDQIISNTLNNESNRFQQININEIEEKLDDCKDIITHFYGQVEQFKINVEKYYLVKEKPQKENVNPKTAVSADIQQKEEEWKKKNLALKQRLTLSDNAKAIFEKKLKQLREENKRLAEKTINVDKDHLYRDLLKEYNNYKAEYDRKIEEYDKKYAELIKDFEAYKNNNEAKVEKAKPFSSKNVKTDDTKKLREAYSNVMTEKSKLDMENSALLKKLDDSNKQIKNLNQIKAAYEKLLEEHNKFRMNLDLVKYNASKEIDTLKKQLKDEQAILSKSYDKQTSQLNAEWEVKLEKMKDRMVILKS